MSSGRGATRQRGSQEGAGRVEKGLGWNVCQGQESGKARLGVGLGFEHTGSVTP